MAHEPALPSGPVPSDLAPPAAPAALSRPASALRWARGLMLASGAAGLGYQIVWTQQCALWLGHETAAVLAVVTAFFGGLAVGAFAAGPRIDRSERPRRWYAACEALIAAWSLVLAVAMAPASEWLLRWTGPAPEPAWQWAVAFGGTFLLLLPATAAMGATLPAMERMTRAFAEGGRSIGTLYAANTFGAVVGVLAAAFWLVPAIGLLRTALLCAALNGLAALAALAAFSARTAVPPAQRMDRAARGALWRLALTGLLGIGYEVVAVRVLSEVAEDTVYTYALLLAVYLVGTAAGAAAWQRWGRERPAEALGDALAAALAVACLAGGASLYGAESLRHLALRALGGGMTAAIGAEAALALAAFALPTLVMGALFSHLCQQAGAHGASLGRSIAVNTLGATAAPLVFGVLLLPALGAKAALLLLAAAYLALALPRRMGDARGWAVAAGLAAAAAWAPPLVFVDVPEGGHLVSLEEGATAAVSVVEDAQGVARLRINNRQQEGSNATQLVDGRQALLPLLLHPAPHRALFLGLGTGVTASTAALDPGLAVDAVELLPEVIAASKHFELEAVGGGSAPRPHVTAADARRHVRASDDRWDVIVADNFHPARSGSGALYTVEHFNAVSRRLADGGLFCQWLPLHQLDAATLRSIVRSFLAVFPDGHAVLASNSLETPVLGLVARPGGAAYETARVAQRLSTSAFAPQLAAYGLEDAYALLGSFVAGPEALARYAGTAPLNTDDRPVVTYLAPRITYAPDSRPRDRLIELLGELSPDASRLVVDAGAAQRLAAYAEARKLYLDAGRNVQPARDARAMLAQVGEPLMAVLRRSPDFRPAYDPLLRMAAALGASDPAAARAVLSALVDVQPARAEARDALAQMEAGARGLPGPR